MLLVYIEGLLSNGFASVLDFDVANARSGNKEYPLHKAATYGQADVLELLCDHGGKPNLTDGM